MKPEFMIERNGKAFVLYAGLLDAAHAQGLQSIRTELLQVPGPDNGQTAICRAEVTLGAGPEAKTFCGLGDASPQNVARGMVNCLIRLAETRAKARALRDAVNVAACSLEELGDEPGQTGHPMTITPPPGYTKPVPDPAPSVPPAAPSTPASRTRQDARQQHISKLHTEPATGAQVKMIAALAERTGEQVSTDGLSRAAASQMITRLKEKAA